jgi:putative NADPH-quinone reductase
MKVSVILAHPDEKSFNHAIAQAAHDELTKAGYDVLYHDLYKESFDPLLPASEFVKDAAVPSDIAKHCHEIAKTDGIIIVHPNWWGQPPAILKGWVDRVIRPGVAYEFLEHDRGEGIPRGLLKAKAALVLNTSNTSTEREKSIFADLLENIWKNCIFGLCGVQNVRRRMFNIIVTSSEEERQKWLREVRQLVLEFIEHIR